MPATTVNTKTFSIIFPQVCSSSLLSSSPQKSEIVALEVDQALCSFKSQISDKNSTTTLFFLHSQAPSPTLRTAAQLIQSEGPLLSSYSSPLSVSFSSPLPISMMPPPPTRAHNKYN
ncbi:hypothetical protein KP509_13G043400 [Ceratopteris richardii]|uniref:Uncharacterized protein n=1 Tax=Ceratopteris richardii TaxID=49495 RepID=A0A8T2TII8_CERRI|nr:hypothetical protein KP509_13G043400 [Ceratopteris richardii]